VYVLFGILFALSKSDKFNLGHFASLGYVFILLILITLFYEPLLNLVERTAKDATSIKFGETEISLSLPVVAIHHIKNDILTDAIKSEKMILRDRTNRPTVLKHLLYLMEFDIDRMKIQYNNLKIQNKPFSTLYQKIQHYEEVYKKAKNNILPLVINEEFRKAMDEYNLLDKEWQSNINQYVPHCQTIRALLYAANNDYATSSRIFKEALKKFPNDVSLLHYCGGLCINDGDLISAIHHTKRAMVLLEDEYDTYNSEYNDFALHVAEIYNNIENDDDMRRVTNLIKQLNIGNKAKPIDYKGFIDKATTYWKYRLAYLLSLCRLEENNARKFSNDLNNYMNDHNNSNASYTDMIGFVKLVFAKNKEEIKEAKKYFKKAKELAEEKYKENQNSSRTNEAGNPKYIIERSSSHIDLANQVLGTKQ
jgi:hypothetical protein